MSSEADETDAVEKTGTRPTFETKFSAFVNTVSNVEKAVFHAVSQILSSLPARSTASIRASGLNMPLPSDQEDSSIPEAKKIAGVQEKSATTSLDMVERSFYHRLLTEKISSPLTQILGFGTSLLREENLKPSVREAVTTIVEKGREISQLIDEYNDLNALLTGSLKIEYHPVLIREFVRKPYLDLAAGARTKGLKFELECNDAVPEILQIDSRRVSYILRNLLDNAMRYTERGSVTLLLSYAPHEELLSIAVSDTGPGMSSETIERRLGANSTGLPLATPSGAPGFGLQFARHIAHAMKGQVSIASAVGQGTTVTLSIQAQECSDTEQLFVVGAGNRSLAGEVLIVDDGLDYHRLYSRQLLGSKVEATYLTSGEDALTLLETKKFDLVLTSIALPDISAATLVRRSRKKGIRQPIIAIASTLSQSLMRATKDAGCTTCVSRETTAEDLLPLIAGVLKSLREPQADSSVIDEINIGLSSESPATMKTERAADWDGGILQHLLEALPVLSQLAQDGKWSQVSEEVQKYREKIEEIQIPLLLEHLMVLEAWSSSQATSQFRRCLQEIEEHLLFYRRGRLAARGGGTVTPAREDSSAPE